MIKKKWFSRSSDPKIRGIWGQNSKIIQEESGPQIALSEARGSEENNDPPIASSEARV